MDFKQFYKTVQFDIDKEIRTILQATQGDTKSRGLLVPVVVNSVVTPITTETMNFFALKPDGTRVMTAGVKDGDKFRIDFTNQTFSVAGTLLCALVLYGTNGEKIADKKFKMTVDSSLEDGAIVSEDERGILDRAFDLASDIVPRLEALDVPLLENLEQEVITARGTEPTLGARLDSTDAQLAETDQRIDNIIAKSSNLFNKDTVTDGYRLNLSTAELMERGDYSVSDFIEVEPQQSYYFKGIANVVRFDNNKMRLSGNDTLSAGQTISTTTSTKYIRVSLPTSNLNEGQINKGSEPVPYEPYLIYLSPEISILKENIYDEETINYMDKYSLLYKTELLPGRDRSADSGGMIAMFDELVGFVYTDYQVERKLWGQDDFGNDLVSYSATKTNMENQFGLERFKVGFLTGTHGNEKGPVVSLLYLLKDLLANEHNNEMFNTVHSLVDFHWFPLVNPSGWNSSTRVNGSGVNINRNFTTHWEITGDMDKGSSPASEPETQAVESWMADNMFDILIDVHTTVDVDNSWFAADHTTDEGTGFIKDYYRTRSILSKWWGDREDVDFPKNTVMGHVDQYNSKLAQSWQHANEIGINACLIELASRYTPDVQADDPVTITFGAETIVNLMLETLKRKRVI